MRILKDFFESDFASLLVSFFTIFIYIFVKGKGDFSESFIGGLFFTLIGGWFLAVPFTYFLASIFEYFEKKSY